MIQIKGLTKSFSGSGSAYKAISLIDLNLKAGELVMLIGANGSGKSTLLNLIAGELIADEGSIQIEDSNITRWPAYRRASLISRIFQDPLQGTAGDLTIIDNIRLAALRRGNRTLRNSDTADFRIKARAQLARLGLGLENRLDLPAGMLSGGQRQALSMLMAVQSSTRLLLLDEPTSALDPHAAQKVLALLDQIHREKDVCILMVSHNMQEATSHGNRVIQMSKGRITRDIENTSSAALSGPQLYQWLAEAE